MALADDLAAMSLWTRIHGDVVRPVGRAMVSVSRALDGMSADSVPRRMPRLREAGHQLGRAASRALKTPPSGAAGLDEPQRASWRLAKEVADEIAALGSRPEIGVLTSVAGLLEQSTLEARRATEFLRRATAAG